MIRVTVSYPTQPGSHFNLDYYLKTHMPLVDEKLGPHGLSKWEILQGVSGPVHGSPAKYQIQANLTFPSLAAMQAALGAEGAVVMADIPNFTDVKPDVQIYQVIG
jgi:uncharacterized protein (TIGR02118 family)